MLTSLTDADASIGIVPVATVFNLNVMLNKKFILLELVLVVTD